MHTIPSKRQRARAIFWLVALAFLLVVYLHVRPSTKRSGEAVETTSAADTGAARQGITAHEAQSLTKARRSLRRHRRLQQRAEPGSEESGDESASSGTEQRDFAFNPWVCRGDLLMQYMHATEQQVTDHLIRKGVLKAGESVKSQFTTGRAALESGWEQSDANPELNDNLNFETDPPMKHVLDGLGLSTTKDFHGGQNVLLDWVHKYTVQIPSTAWGKWYYATGAVYTNIYDARQGALFATFNYGPAYEIKHNEALKQEHPDIEPPPLNHWSDFALIMYDLQVLACLNTGGHCATKDLKYIFQVICTNDDTKDVTNYILNPDHDFRRLARAPEWNQRKIYTMDSDEGKAILATPNGRGVAWMLIQHRDLMGQKRVKSMSVFSVLGSGGVYQGPTLLFELEDVPAQGDMEMGGM